MRKNYKRLTASSRIPQLASLTGCGSSNKEETHSSASTERERRRDTAKVKKDKSRGNTGYLDWLTDLSEVNDDAEVVE